ncbi:MAG: helix-turn-helix domain-containing protein [Candidatus Buchananbacteria bacterium]
MPENKFIENLGENLKETRLKRGVSLLKASSETKIATKYLEALEQNQPWLLPGPDYLPKFLKTYCDYLGLDYSACQTVADSLQFLSYKSLKNKNLFVWSNFISQAAVIIGIIALLAFLIWRVNEIFRPPQLIVSRPADGLITVNRQLDVTGKSSREAEIVINNKTVFVDTGGNFSTTVDLQKGLNLIKITAKKRYSRQSEATIRVLFNEINQ